MVKKKINGLDYLVYKKKEENTISGLSIKMMERNEIHGLLPFKNMQSEGKVYFCYRLDSEEMLSYWLERAHSKKQIISLVEDLLIIADELEMHLLPQNHLCMEEQFIFVSQNQCRFAYIPEEEYMQKSVLDLIKDILFVVKYAMDEDFFYLFNIQNAFSRGDIKSLSDIKKWLKIVNGIEPEEIRDEEPEIFDKNGEDLFQEYGKQNINLQTGQKDFLGEINPDFILENTKSEKKEKKGFFKKKEKIKKEEISDVKDFSQSNDNKVKTNIINNLNREDVTILVGNETKNLLIRKKTGEEYVLNQNSYILGKDKCADIRIQDNQTISRQHARISFDGEYHFIEDLGSTNGTFLNGQALKCNEPCKLQNMSKIVLSDEEFIYEKGR